MIYVGLILYIRICTVYIYILYSINHISVGLRPRTLLLTFTTTSNQFSISRLAITSTTANQPSPREPNLGFGTWRSHRPSFDCTAHDRADRADSARRVLLRNNSPHVVQPKVLEVYETLSLPMKNYRCISFSLFLRRLHNEMAAETMSEIIQKPITTVKHVLGCSGPPPLANHNQCDYVLEPRCLERQKTR